MKTVHVGLGPIGLRVIEFVDALEGADVVAAVDKDPAKVGSSLADLADATGTKGVLVSDDLEATLAAAEADVAVLATSSRLEGLVEDIETAARHGVNVVSTSEELSYPWRTVPEAARKIDGIAREGKITVVGVGVNPGFVMDNFTAFSTAACTDVNSVRVLRKVDLRTRRQQLKDKMAVGLSEEEFRRRADANQLGHVGLVESFYLVADGLGWRIDGPPQRSLEPVLGSNGDSGAVIGIRELVSATDARGHRLELELEMNMEADDARDEIVIDATPPVQLVINGGIGGDHATAALVTNYLPVAVEAEPGLRTVNELRPATSWNPS